ncbi:uncharacterized protein LOC127129579 [Lathyrus oleraceus]|uniref:uncharacterized protein LOC127129579 n=1 Tax=Pisum sativum TaxID=3888 RepID=UPI0021D377C3|nr:uncharacterized protein LOC127129579 [Pisum sativum]
MSFMNFTKELWKVAVKVHHKWIVISNDKEHIELIFVDADGTNVHVIVPINLKATFDSVLLVNNTYTVMNFLPRINDRMFKTSEHPYVIRFTPGTRVSDINKHEIPGKRLNFKPFAETISRNWKSDLLMLLDCNDTLNCTLWETYAVKFMNYIQMNNDGGPSIILLQYAKVKAEGKYPFSVLNTYNITNLLINEDVPNIVEF